MTLIAWIGATTTVLSVVVFAAVIWWATGRSRAERFAQAALAPFVLADEALDPAVAPSRGASS
jgi:cbb3-type cytochrome oxidase subunit 3